MKKISSLTGMRRTSFYRWGSRAFSLVEVVLALGIVSFALLGMVALLPAGIQSTKSSLEESGAINLLSNVIADRKTSDPTAASTLYQVPALTAASSNIFGITSANTKTTTFSQSDYRITYEIIPPPAVGMNPYQVYFKVSWPAAASALNPAGYVEQCITIPQP